MRPIPISLAHFAIQTMCSALRKLESEREREGEREREREGGSRVCVRVQI